MYNIAHPPNQFRRNYATLRSTRFSLPLYLAKNNLYSYENMGQNDQVNKKSKMHINLSLKIIIVLLCSSINVFAVNPLGNHVPDIERANILLIVVDDMGYTDLGSFGGEIETPNLDSLADAGILLTNYHTAATCSPTRSMLLSGTDHHLAGLGTMVETMRPEYKGQAGYEGYLNDRVAALPELLQDAGYHTYMTGKWHLGMEEFNSPAARGFERSYALLNGYAGHFKDDTGGAWAENRKSTYHEDGKIVTIPEDFYSTRFYTEKLIQYIDENTGDGKPFFAYMSYTAPHWPLQAPADSIARYQGKYDEGYDILQSRRVARLKQLGLVDDSVEPAPRLQGQPAWDELNPEQQLIEARKMEIYAAMLNELDSYVGHLVTYLKKINVFDNTFIFFMSDNGAAGTQLNMFDEVQRKLIACCDNSYENMGKANSFIWYGPNWAWSGTSPYKYFKGYSTEGGIRTPAFIHYPGLRSSGSINKQFLSVMDIMPTLLQLANIEHPGVEYEGKEVLPMKGKSMLPMLQGHTSVVHGADYVMGWELFGRRAIRKDQWKIVWGAIPPAAGNWQLFNIEADPAESNDLSVEHPEVLQEMIGLWGSYVKDNGVILPVRH